ncbi:MAG TPA: DUF3667 domain-containing protein [Sphingomicrobium sp.]|nr:DUF3667 domain-containing protein [Sphingomicrobium sp.]
MNELDGIGGVVTGGLLAQALEPDTGEIDGRREGRCLNCGTPLSGPYCSECGQRAVLHRSLLSFLQDFVQGIYNFEGKIWRTLPMLAWCPGDLTRRYIHGERARYVSPVALYLFSVFAMFAVLNFNGSIGPQAGSVKDQVETAAKEERADLTRLEAERKRIVARGGNIAAIDKRIAGKKKDLVQLQKVQSGEMIQMEGLDEGEAPRWVRNAVERAQKNPELAIYNVQDAASKYSWLLIPISVPFLWLLFPLNRRYHLYDHTIFVTYSLSFMMMLVILGGLLIAVGMTGLASVLFFLPPVHMYRQLKGAYGLSRWGALLRTFALLTFALIAGLLFFATMVAIGVL